MENKLKKISDYEWLVTLTDNGKPIFSTRIYKDKKWYCNDHNTRESKTLSEMKNYFMDNINDFI